MLCPLHRLPLRKSEKHGIEIDYCPQCYGAWFERGELDKVIEAYAEIGREARARAAMNEARYRDRRERPRKRRRMELEDFLEDLFDFD